MFDGVLNLSVFKKKELDATHKKNSKLHYCVSNLLTSKVLSNNERNHLLQ